jgi:hypothetical protein
VNAEALAAIGTAIAATLSAVVSGVTTVRVESIRAEQRATRRSAERAAINSEPVSNGAMPALIDGTDRIEGHLRSMIESLRRQGGRIDEVVDRVAELRHAVDANRSTLDDLGRAQRDHLRDHLREGVGHGPS